MDFPKKYKPNEVEPRLRQFWSDEGIYRYDPDSEKLCFSVDTPPPYVSSAHLHVGHAMSYSQAEFIVRYKRMCGHNVFYPMGFDDNGLPTERYVEKKYKVNKSKINRQEFIELCLKETRLGAQTYRELWESLGISVDWSLSYSTIDERSRRAAQRSFLELVHEGLIERRDEPILWCYQCATAIAQADVDTVELPSQLHDVAFHTQDGRELVISTTRPELIPACVALYVHPDDDRYSALVGSMVTVPLSGHQVEIRTHPSVDSEFGTGLMMVCTWGDFEDVAKWKEHQLDTRVILDERGRLNELAGQFAGHRVDEGRKQICHALAEVGLLRNSRKIDHSVGIHERCSTPVEFNHSLQWFINVLGHKDTLLARATELKWYPEFMKARYDDWVRGLKWDWCISRQRYYGVPFPVWYCDACAAPWYPTVAQLPVDPTVDTVPSGVRCGCGCTEFTGEDDVMDTWMTSSLTPLINARWAENDAQLMSSIYPQSIRVQAFEIIRTWLFYTVAKSHFHTDSLPWKHVMISGWGLDSKGKKMSKRLGNFVDPTTVIQKYSADALRYWSAGSTLGSNLRYSEQNVADGKRLMTKLWNATRFVSMFLFDESGETLPLKSGDPTVVDRWILSRYMRTVEQTTQYFERYEYSHALAATERFFFSEFCDNYLEIVKQRLWNPERFTPEQVDAARMTLSTVMLGVLKLFAPFIPYITEELYQIVFRSDGLASSIHVTEWPAHRTDHVDTEAESLGGLLVDVLTGVRRWKTSQKVHANFPLAEMVITAGAEVQADLQAILTDLQAASHAEEIRFGAGGAIPTDAEGITLGLTLGSK